jgi:mRNA interferase MazF
MDFGKTVGREQSGKRPGLIVSVDPFNQGGSELLIAVPVTSKRKGVRSHVAVPPPEGGLNLHSWIKCEDIRAVSRQRLLQRLGAVTPATMVAVEDRLRILLGL